MYEKEIVIVNETGLHARPATEFVQLAGTFASTITLRHAENERAFHAKSILMVLSMGLDKGAAVTLCPGTGRAGSGRSAICARSRVQRLSDK